MTRRCRQDRGQLRGVGAARAVDILGVKQRVQPGGRDLVGGVRKWRATLVDEVVHDSVASQRIEPICEVLPEQELREGELAEPDLGLDLPAREVSDGVAECLEDSRDVHAALVFGQRIQSRDFHAEVLPEHLHQREVEEGLFLDTAEAEAVKD